MDAAVVELLDSLVLLYDAPLLLLLLPVPTAAPDEPPAELPPAVVVVDDEDEELCRPHRAGFKEARKEEVFEVVGHPNRDRGVAVLLLLLLLLLVLLTTLLEVVATA